MHVIRDFNKGPIFLTDPGLGTSKICAFERDTRLLHMLECHACFRRYFNAITALHSSPSPLRFSPRTTLFVGWLQHGRSSGSLAVEEAPQSYYKMAKNGKSSLSETSGHGKSELASSLQRTTGKSITRKFEHKTSSKEAEVENKKLKRAAEEELRWLRDPLRLSERVRAVLPRKGGSKPVLAETKALALVRAASKGMDCVVAWNHIIDHYMAQGRPKLAQKIFNEVGFSCSSDAIIYHVLTTESDEKTCTVP